MLGNYVFISYSQHDQEFVERLVIRLKDQLGWEAWWFFEKQIPGESFTKQLIHKISGASVMIVILSPHSADSRPVLREILFAEKVTQIIPLLLEPCPQGGEVVFHLSYLHWIDATNGRDPLPQLKKALELPLPAPLRDPDPDDETQLPTHSGPDHPSPISSGQILHGRYRIICKIGVGGMGRVYKAEHIELNKIVAIKEAIANTPQLLKILNKEARLLVQLEHPVLPKVTDYFTEQNRQYLVMDFIPGKDLHEQLVTQQNPFPLSDVLGWAEQLLNVLDYLHSQPDVIIHHDIKPQNIKLKSTSIMLLDFGLAKATKDSIIPGYTPQYAPPEQILGEGTDGSSDLYALCTTLYHLLTGVVPVNALDRQKALHWQQPDPLRPAHELNLEIPQVLSRWLLHGMAIEKTQRPGSAQAMLVELQKIRKIITPEDIDDPVTPVMLTGDDTDDDTTRLRHEASGSATVSPPDVGVDVHIDDHVNPIIPPDDHTNHKPLRSSVPISMIFSSIVLLVLVVSGAWWFTEPPALSNQIVFTTNRDGHEEIYVMHTDGTQSRSLTNHPARDQHAAVSSDGKAIAFVSDRDGRDQIYVMAANGSKVRQVTTSGGNMPAWSPDVTQIVFARDGAICVIDRNGADEICLTDSLEQDRDPNWSQYGIVFERNHDIYVMNADGTSLRNITNSPGIQEKKPAWSPIGRQIVFAANEDSEVDDIYVMNANGENRINLTRNPSRIDSDPAWSPDGTRIVYRSATAERRNQIFVIHVDGTAQRERLTETDANDTLPVWSP